MSIIKNKINENNKIIVKIQVLNDDLEKLINKSKKFFELYPSFKGNNDSPKSFIENFLPIYSKNISNRNLEDYVYISNCFKELAYSELSDNERKAFMWYPTLDKEKSTITSKFVNLEYIFYKKPSLVFLNEYDNFYLESPNDYIQQNHFLSVMKYMFDSIVKYKFYTIPDSKIYDSTNYHAIVSWNYIDKNGIRTTKEPEKYCESFFPFAFLKEKVRDIKNQLLGMKIRETKKIELDVPENKYTHIYVRLECFIKIDWDSYCKFINLDKFESVDDVCSYLKEEANRFDNELYFMTQSLDISKIIANSMCYDNDERELKQITSKFKDEARFLLNKKILDEKDWYYEDLDMHKFLYQDSKMRDRSYKDQIDLFISDLILFNLSVEDICKKEKIIITDDEWKSLALKKFQSEKEKKFFSYLECSDRNIFLQKQALKLGILTKEQENYLNSLSEFDIIEFKFKAKKLKLFKKLLIINEQVLGV